MAIDLSNIIKEHPPALIDISTEEYKKAYTKLYQILNLETAKFHSTSILKKNESDDIFVTFALLYDELYLNVAANVIQLESFSVSGKMNVGYELKFVYCGFGYSTDPEPLIIELLNHIMRSSNVVRERYVSAFNEELKNYMKDQSKKVLSLLETNISNVDRYRY